MKKDLIAVKGVCLANSSYLRDFFKLNKVPVYLETRLDEITGKGIIASGKDGRKFEIAGDSVIMSAGYKPKSMKNSRSGIFVGDCHKVGNLRTVVWRAWDVAMKL
jgi:2-enoate reductase